MCEQRGGRCASSTTPCCLTCNVAATPFSSSTSPVFSLNMFTARIATASFSSSASASTAESAAAHSSASTISAMVATAAPAMSGLSWVARPMTEDHTPRSTRTWCRFMSSAGQVSRMATMMS